MGKNTLGKVPHDVARRLKLAKPKDYVFHSYRRKSATTAANGGSTAGKVLRCVKNISPPVSLQTLGSFDFGEPWFTSFQCDCQKFVSSPTTVDL
jgi:hypothetical protein